MEIKNEHIIGILVIFVCIWLYTKHTEKFNVIENRWDFPLNNIAGDAWTKEFAMPAFYSNPDGILTEIPIPPQNIPKNPYKEQIYDGTFEIPEFNYENMPVPRNNTNTLSYVDETSGNFSYGPSCDKMPDSDSQQHYYHLKRQMQMFEEQEKDFDQAKKYEKMTTETEQPTQQIQQPQQPLPQQNVVFVKPKHNNVNIILVIVIILMAYYIYTKHY